MLMYFALLHTALGFPAIPPVLRVSWPRLSLKSLGLWAALLGGCALVVHRYTMAHPYLLADNRHYPFYIWKAPPHPSSPLPLTPCRTR